MTKIQPMPHPRQNPRAAIGMIGLSLGILGLLVGLLWGLPSQDEAHIYRYGDRLYPSLVFLPIFAFISGFGLAIPLACFWVNRRNLRAVLRFTWGRGLSALIMAALMPAGFVGIIPVWLWIVLGFNGLQLKHPDDLSNFFLSSPSSVQSFIYALAALGLITVATFSMIYGLRKRWRIPALIFLWLGISATLVLSGFWFAFVL
ncbi:hypothetical protein [Neogemmobacter tilapiae]|uniref:hypothetical protein n=1 Tax=Neogemmobacter tilapiae TaxID=875041 RepID=UPI001678226A|nr:hypothetical protein [Gemmobacter tilapiae]